MKYLTIACISMAIIGSVYFFLSLGPRVETGSLSLTGVKTELLEPNHTVQYSGSLGEEEINEEEINKGTDRPELNEEQLIVKRLFEILGAGAYISAEESIEYERWREEIGYFYPHPKDTDYGAYTVETLISLAEQGDLRAYETLISTPDELLQGKLDSDQRLHLGVVAGSNPALYITFSKMYDIANEHYEKGNIDAYKEFFTEQLAYIEIYTLRGDGFGPKTMQRIKDNYKLEDIGFVLEQSERRSVELIDEINAERAQLALAPLSFDLPDVAKRVQKSLMCEGDKTCLAQYTPSEYL